MSVRRIGRFDIFHLWPAGYRALQALENSVEQADLDPALLEIVRTRVSQVNACSFCLDMHAKAAIACGEDPLRLIQLSAWREADCYSDAERAALALAEELTHCSAGVTDATIEGARIHFPSTQFAQLVYAITAINAWNRLVIVDRTPHSSITDADGVQ